MQHPDPQWQMTLATMISNGVIMRRGLLAAFYRGHGLVTRGETAVLEIAQQRDRASEECRDRPDDIPHALWMRHFVGSNYERAHAREGERAERGDLEPLWSHRRPSGPLGMLAGAVVFRRAPPERHIVTTVRSRLRDPLYALAPGMINADQVCFRSSQNEQNYQASARSRERGISLASSQRFMLSANPHAPCGTVSQKERTTTPWFFSG
jgi:hypothetical protein